MGSEKHSDREHINIPEVRKELAASIEGLTLMDDVFMQKFFEGDIACVEYMLRVILDKNDLMIAKVCHQHKIKNLSSHGVCLDVLVFDTQGRQYDIEIQRDARGASPFRARYYSSMLDIDSLHPGDDYEDLPETYVIFVTATDVLGEGRAIYRIDRVLLESGRLFGDGSHIVFANTSAQEESSPLGDLLHDFSCPDPAQMRCTLFSERAGYLKVSMGGVRAMEFEVGGFAEAAEKLIYDALVADVTEEVTEEVTKQVTADVTKQVTADVTKQVTADVTKQVTADVTQDHARRMLMLGYLDRDEIAECLSLSRENVDALAEEMTI